MMAKKSKKKSVSPLTKLRIELRAEKTKVRQLEQRREWDARDKKYTDDRNAATIRELNNSIERLNRDLTATNANLNSEKNLRLKHETKIEGLKQGISQLTRAIDAMNSGIQK